MNFIVLMSLVLIVKDGRAEIDIVNRLSDISCSVKIFRAEYPIAMEGRSLAASSAAPVPSDNTVTTILDGIGTGAVCNNTWRNLSSSSGKLDQQNTIRCRVFGDRQTIELDMELYNQATHDIPHEAAPSESGYAEPASTSESTSYCQKETYPDSAEACKWQTYDGTHWLVYAKTTVENLTIGFVVPYSEDPASLPEYFCARDGDGNGVIESGEFGECISTPQGR